MMTNKKMYLRNMETGEETEIINGTAKMECFDNDTSPVNIYNLYYFECDVKFPLMNQAAKDLFFDSPAWKTTNRLADKLNSLIEEYHAPGNTRKVRRAVQRQFDKTFKIFRQHCLECNIQYTFQQPNK